MRHDLSLQDGTLCPMTEADFWPLMTHAQVSAAGYVKVTVPRLR